MFNSLFKNKDKTLPIDFSLLKTDVHSHLIPAIDDGSGSLEESLTLIRKFSEMGYKKLITTPHVMSDYYQNTPEIILLGLEKLQKAISLEVIPIEMLRKNDKNIRH